LKISATPLIYSENIKLLKRKTTLKEYLGVLNAVTKQIVLLFTIILLFKGNESVSNAQLMSLMFIGPFSHKLSLKVVFLF